MLGVHISLLLQQNRQFKVMIEKIEVVVHKLKNTSIPRYLTYIVFNAYIMKSVYFGYRIIELNQRQVEILKQIYEEVIAEKIGLGKKFLRKILYVRKTIMGIELISPDTAVKMQVLNISDISVQEPILVR